jgi:hypothetical protein
MSILLVIICNRKAGASDRDIRKKGVITGRPQAKIPKKEPPVR